MIVRAGEMALRLQVQEKKITGTGDRGQPEFQWVTILTTPAYVEPLSGRKLELARQQVATASHEVQVRYIGALTPQHRLVFNGRVFSIGSLVNKQEANFRQILLVTEVQNAAG